MIWPQDVKGVYDTWQAASGAQVPSWDRLHHEMKRMAIVMYQAGMREAAEMAGTFGECSLRDQIAHHATIGEDFQKSEQS